MLTQSGPSPTVVRLAVEARSPLWTNQDTVTHSVVFANGRCSLQVAPGEQGDCSDDFFARVGRYPYTVDGAACAPAPARHSRRLLGTGTAASLRGHAGRRPGAPRSSPGVHRVATVARRARRQPGGGFPWRLRVQPTATTTYIAEATYQPGFEFWQDATSRPFAVVVR